MSAPVLQEDFRDGLQEVANIAIGQSADQIARSFSSFVKLPIPKVNLMESSDIVMTLSALRNEADVVATVQPFVGAGVSGEALLIVSNADISGLSTLVGQQSTLIPSERQEQELVLEISSLLSASCVQSICNQLVIPVLLKHPKVLSQLDFDVLLSSGTDSPWSTTLAIEMNYEFEDSDIVCDLILLFHEKSMTILQEQLSLLLE